MADSAFCGHVCSRAYLGFYVFRQNCSYRPTDDSNQPPGRGVLSMHGLTYGVIRVDSEEKLSVLTVQDVGLVMPGGECRPGPQTVRECSQYPSRGRWTDQISNASLTASAAPLAGALGMMPSSSLLTCLLSFMVGSSCPSWSQETQNFQEAEDRLP